MQIMIIGGGRVGTFLAKRLRKEQHAVILVEKDQKTAHEIAADTDALVIHADGCDSVALEQAGVERADVFVAATGKDEDNFVCCQIAKEQFKVNRTIARVNDPENEKAFNELGIDVPVGATVILGKIIEEEASFMDFMNLYSFEKGKLSLIRVDLPDNSPVVNKRVQDLKLPPQSVLVSIVRGDDVIIPKGDTTLHSNDYVIALTLLEHKKQLLNYFIGDAV